MTEECNKGRRALRASHQYLTSLDMMEFVLAAEMYTYAKLWLRSVPKLGVT
jgi:hypothetical protein